MTLLRLSLVTQALLEVVQRAVTTSPEWVSGTTLNTSPDPPDKLTGDHTIGLYLYHAGEDPARRNDPPVPDASLEARHTPMGLVLHYVLTARSDLTGGMAPLEEQFLMGLAMKALRDFPAIDDATRVGGVQVMPVGARDRANRFHVAGRVVDAADAVGYWTAGQNPLRLAAYYDVSAVLLEPEPVATRARRVLAFDVRTFVGSGPRLTSSRSVVTFTVPGEAAPRMLELQPAEAAAGEQLELLGSGLTGDATALLLHHAAWSDPEVIEPMTWGVVAQGDRVIATVQKLAGAQPVLPGVYAASVRVLRMSTAADGTQQQIVASSNRTPFTVAPAVTTVSPPTATGRITVIGGRFDAALLPGEDIQAYLGAVRLTRRATGATQPGQFKVMASDKLELRLPAGVAKGTTVAVRIVVRGAESAPRWVTVP